MARQIYKVDAWIVDANGSFATLSGYPKIFDSKNYNDDIEKTRRRAEGDMSETWGAMCKRDDRQIQTVVMSTIGGVVMDRHSNGSFPGEEPEE